MDSTSVLPWILLLVTITWTICWIRWLRPRAAESPQQRQQRLHALYLGLFAWGVIGLFLGMMVAVAIGSMSPRVIMIAAPVVCDGAPTLQSGGYSYKPGQHGSWSRIICTHPSGELRDITLRTIAVASVIHAVILLTLLLWLRTLWLLHKRFVRRRDAVTRPRSGSLPS